jgi:hypothetical protein
LPFLLPIQIPVPVLLPLTRILHFMAQLRNYSCTQWKNLKRCRV